ncbi:response regulator [Paracoccus sediminis]|uniref:histidine kinase n=1 Tax=Paracoccus sediminis TaxID=1214787 RepID=A0A238US33_9RHOB|nr:ATP-binding protein [Paracoccus sediminis]TBN52916.1 response regulator [Paracoccus sediminis]SNR24477.1 two-component system, cell cycle sensor histidine kinase and response regulator CckA [Paracoccus sediminis]
MTFGDTQSALSRNAAVALPLLMFPVAVSAIVALAAPQSNYGAVALVVGTVAVAWYILGGVISLGYVLDRLAARRALAAIRHEVAAAPDPVWICDSDGLVMMQNDASRTGFGDIAGQNILRVMSELRADAAEDLAALVRRAGYAGCADLALGTGDTLTVSRAEDAPLQIWSYHRQGAAIPPSPIDDDPQDADDFEAIPVALLRITPGGHIRRANAAARRLLGNRLPEGSEPVHVGTLLDGPGRAIGEWIAETHAARRTESRGEVLRLRSPDDAAREQHFQVTLAMDPVEQAGLIAVLHDASALKTLEAQFVQSQKMQAIGQLAGGVAHDFNNLLTAIRGHCDLLMLRHDKGDPDYADLDQIGQNANRAAALVGQLLAFSRRQQLKLETLDPRDVLAELTHLLNRLVGEKITLTITHDPVLRAIRADKRQLEQVIMNLVVNARDAMTSGGTIEICTDVERIGGDGSRGKVSLPKGDYLRIRVTDEGCGIEPALLDKIFEPFFTTKRVGEGTGLGLSTAYGIVKQTGGYIFCDSEVGKGTCFSLYFPAQAGRAPAARPAPAPAPVPHSERRATVLLVEDEAPVRAFAARALRLKGYDVHEAASAEEALSVLEGTLAVDIFVTDVVMPGMDGPTWVRMALQDRPGTRVIFVSGYTEDIFGEGHAPIENATFLAKPFTLNELAQCVARQLQDPPRRPDA